MFGLQRRGSKSYDPRCPSLARNMDFTADRRWRVILIGRQQGQRQPELRLRPGRLVASLAIRKHGEPLDLAPERARRLGLHG